jgi:homoserine kinase type II
VLEARDGQRYFARVYEEQGAAGAAFELRVNEALSEAGIPVARPLRVLDGRLHLYHAGKPFAVYELVEGESLCQKSVDVPAAWAVGAALASVHVAPLPGLALPEGRFGLASVEPRLRLVEASGRGDLLPAVVRARGLVERLSARRPVALPAGLVHGDLFRDNVLLARGERPVRVAALLDFESACRGSYAYDLMVTLLAWCFGSELEAPLARAIVEGYQSVRPLTDLERAELVTEGSVAVARFVSTRLTDFSLRAPVGQAPGRQYQRFFQRLDALESGALDRALEGVF